MVTQNFILLFIAQIEIAHLRIHIQWLWSAVCLLVFEVTFNCSKKWQLYMCGLCAFLCLKSGACNVQCGEMISEWVSTSQRKDKTERTDSSKKGNWIGCFGKWSLLALSSQAVWSSNLLSLFSLISRQKLFTNVCLFVLGFRPKRLSCTTTWRHA